MICPHCGEWIKDSCLITGDRVLSDEDAEKEIKRGLKELRDDDGRKEFNTLDIMIKTDLPVEQIERIIDKLRKR